MPTPLSSIFMNMTILLGRYLKNMCLFFFVLDKLKKYWADFFDGFCHSLKNLKMGQSYLLQSEKWTVK